MALVELFESIPGSGSVDPSALHVIPLQFVLLIDDRPGASPAIQSPDDNVSRSEGGVALVALENLSLDLQAMVHVTCVPQCLGKAGEAREM